MKIKLMNASIDSYCFRKKDLCLAITGFVSKWQEAQYVVGFDMDQQCCEDNYILLKGGALTEEVKISRPEDIKIVNQYLKCGKHSRRHEDLILTIEEEKELPHDEYDGNYHYYINVNLQWGDLEFNMEFHNIHNGYYVHRLYVNKMETVYERIL